MIGKPQWFGRRKYGGWGLTPKTWQGWAYVAAFIVPLVVVGSWPGISPSVKLAVSLVFGAVLVADVMHIMVIMPKDERDRMHEALAERNALWTMLAVLVIGVLYQSWPKDGAIPMVDPVIIAAILSAVVAKAATNVYLDRRD